MSEPLLQSKTPCEIVGRNFRRGYREPQIGKVYTIQFEVDKETWDACELVPKTALIKGVLWWESEESEQEVQPETEKAPVRDNSEKASHPPPAVIQPGPHGQYWSGMYRKGFINYPDLIEVCGCAGDQIRLRLHDMFEVSSLTEISPQAFEDWCASEALHSLITLSRQVRAKLQEAA